MADDYSTTDESIDVLIGSDYFWDFLTGSRFPTLSGLFIIPSTLGSLIGGRYTDTCGESTQSSLLCITDTFSRVPNESGLLGTKSRLSTPYPDIDEFWDLEKIGITDDPKISDDDVALKQFNNSVRFTEGRYSVKWPWKDNSNNLPSNYELALGRLRSLAKRLRTADPKVLEAYQKVIEEQLQKHVIERVPDGENCHRIHYLPHHPVVKPSSTTTKVRIVYDASAKTRRDNPSLNECLYRGPVLLPELCGILLRFRLRRVAMVADIEKAFLQLSLQPDDRDVTRFLWFNDASSSKVDDNVVAYRFCRVPFGIISSPFLLNASILYHLRSVGDRASREVSRNIYVDNVITGVDTIEDAMAFYSRAKEIFNGASMNLQEWCSNSTVVMDQIAPEDRVKQRDNKILGMFWDSLEDTLRLKYNADLQATTKRQVLQSVASIYDPLGLFQPVLLQAKLFLQSLWDGDKKWDEPIAEDDSNRWSKLWEDVRSICEIRVPRCPYELGDSHAVTIVAFCDASAVAYATAVYLRVLKKDRTWKSFLVYAKSRLAPRKRSTESITLPRMELLGVTIGVRAAMFVRNSISPEDASPAQVYMFTDSTCVLHWLNSTKPLSVFVENRIAEVKRMQKVEYLYVNTKENPADLNTRGKTVEELKSSSLWWSGPEWLERAREKWPDEVSPPNDQCDTDQWSVELRKTPSVFHTILAGEGPISLMGIDPSKFSSLRKLQRVTARCLKFIKMLLWDDEHGITRAIPESLQSVFEEVTVNKHVSAAEISQAQSMWVRFAQEVEHGDVYSAVTQGKSNYSLIKQLGLTLDERRLLRCRGRFQHADLPFETIQPVLLPKKGHITELVVRDVHGRLFHSGVSHTLCQLRRQFWIPQGRAVVRRVLNRCVLCRKHKGGPFSLPKMPPWPKERLSRSSPFQFIGLDYMGPISIRVGQNVQKMWICLFTCLAVRAVHLEWVSDCSAQEFLRCVIRFVSRRGTPSQIISDNAPQFRVTKTMFDKIWHNILRDDEVRSYVANEGINWKFTTELAPWQGGFYERLVGVVKSALRAGIGRRLLAWEEFITIIAEAESIVNTRPITYVYGEFSSGKSLRPIDFLTDLAVRMHTTGAQMKPDGLGEAGKNLVRLWKYRQKHLDSLWDVWYSEYLLSLRERYQSTHKPQRGEISLSPTLDQIVLVKETDNPRGSWKLGRVVKLITSADESVRSVEVLLPNGSVLRRSVSFLFPLEIDSANNKCDNQTSKSAINEDANNYDEADFDGFTEAEAQEAEQRNSIMRNGLTSIAMTLNF